MRYEYLTGSKSILKWLQGMNQGLRAYSIQLANAESVNAESANAKSANAESANTESANAESVNAESLQTPNQ
jgi:hypothetical protein